MQTEHSAGVEPATSLYVPAAQMVQGPALGPMDPALQIQSAAVVLPAGAFELSLQASQFARAVLPMTVEYVPTGQFSQALVPGLGLYLPAKHSTHVPPSGPDDPALHLQSFSSLLPTSECDRSGQTVHDSKVVPAELTEYLPAGHGKQADGLGPEPILYVPGTHAVHRPPLAPVYPASHWQSVLKALRTADVVECNGHSAHCDDHTRTSHR